MVARGIVDVLRMTNRQTVESIESTHQAWLMTTDSKKGASMQKYVMQSMLGRLQGAWQC